jgi:hypothetical protein
MDQVKESLRQRYPNIHPLIFQRSLEKSRSNVDLFDILEGIKEDYPLIWDEKTRTWKKTDNLLQAILK